MHTSKRLTAAGLAAVGLLMGTACASAPTTRADQHDLRIRADATLEAMVERDPSLGEIVAGARGYVVFPNVGEGGLVFGGAQGVGVVYEHGLPRGYAELNEGSVGAQIGARSYSQLVVFLTEPAWQRFRRGQFTFNADASATALTAGAARSASFAQGVEVFIDRSAGVMAEASIAGQSLSFVPCSATEEGIC